MKINKDIIFKASQGLHKASLGTSSVAIESNAKRIPKETKEYLARRLESVVRFRDEEPGRTNGERWYEL